MTLAWEGQGRPLCQKSRSKVKRFKDATTRIISTALWSTNTGNFCKLIHMNTRCCWQDGIYENYGYQRHYGMNTVRCCTICIKPSARGWQHSWFYHHPKWNILHAMGQQATRQLGHDSNIQIYKTSIHAILLSWYMYYIQHTKAFTSS